MNKVNIFFLVLALTCCTVAIVDLSGCTVPVVVASATGGATTVGGVAWWLTNQPWAARICYWVGDEAALTAMPNASRNVDADTIAVCGELIAFFQGAQNTPAATINAQLAATIAKLPPAQVAQIQEAAAVLDEFLPAADSALPLTSNQLNDAVQFVTGWQDGTTTCLNNLPAASNKAFNARAKIAGLRADHPVKAMALKPGGWFKSAGK